MSKEHNETVQAIATLIKENHSFDNGVFTTDANVAETALEAAGVTLDTVKAVHEARNNIMAGAALAIGELGLEQMKKDDKLDRVSFSSKLHNDEISLAYGRKGEYRNPKDPDGEKIVKHGVLDARYVAKGTQKNSGALKKISTSVNEAWKALA